MPEGDSRRRLLRLWARLGAGVLAGAGLSGLPAGALAATIVAVRVWPSRDYTRVTFELDEPLRSTQMQLSDPPRLVVDLEGLEIDLALRQLIAKVQPDDPYIQQVRIGQNQPRVARIVLDLKKTVEPQLFALPPVGNYRHRLVLDLYPAQPVDPLASLLEQSRAVPAAPNRARMHDPIAALLERQPPDPDSTGVRAPAQAPAAHRGARTRPGRGEDRRIATIAIDAGHGGEDPGAIGRRGTREKDVVLRIAQLLRERIQAAPGMRPFMTRDGDYFVPLATRVAKARQVDADLLVSIHADAFVRPSARGASVYVLSDRGATSSAAGWLARKENASDRIGGVNLGQRNREARQVLLDLSTSEQIRQSSVIGSKVLAELGDIGNLHKPRIEQAGFAVLKAPDIPSILVETAFISNPDEERRLSDPRYQDRVADAIFRGIRAWLASNPPAPRRRLA
jgi:N-acetylmuramoyl-L-alanine amidase